MSENEIIYPCDIMSEDEASQVSAASLAYLGDSVLEVLVREKLVRGAVKNPSVVSLKYVTAYARIEGSLTEKESDMFRRGRNCVHSGVPRHATPSQYRRATGLETLFGFLYLTGNMERVRVLFSEAYPEI